MRRTTFMSKKFNSVLGSSVLQMLILFLLSSTDTIIAGYRGGSEAVAAVNVILPLFSVAAFSACLIAVGVPVIYGKSIGKFDRERADQSFQFGILMCLFIGMMLFLVTILLGDPFILFFDPTPAIYRLAGDYLYWYKAVMIVMPIQTLLCAMLVLDGNEKLVNIASVVMILFNVGASILLSAFMGLAGIGLGTFLGYGLSLVILTLHFLKRDRTLKLGLYFDRKLVRDTFLYSMVDTSAYIFPALLFIFMNKFVATYFGAAVFPLVAVINLIKQAGSLFDSTGMAMKPIMSVYMGEESAEEIRKCWKHSMIGAMVISFGTLVIVMATAGLVPVILGFTEPDLVHDSIVGTRLIALSFPVEAVLYQLSTYYLLREKPLLGTLVCGMRDCLCTVPLIVLGAVLFGIYGMFIGIALSTFLGYVLVRVFVSARYGRDRYPLLLDDSKSNCLLEIGTDRIEIASIHASVDDYLSAFQVSQKAINRCQWIVEEMLTLIKSLNGSKIAHVEILITAMEEGVRVIIKDDGKLFSLTDTDNQIGSLEGYVVSQFMNYFATEDNYLLTLNCNRNTFLIPME